MNKKRLLIVDDEPDTLAVLEEGFVQEGFAVTTVTSAKALGAALKLAGPDSPDLIILDIDLPDMNGIEIAKKLKENSEIKDIPIMFLSALFSKEQEREYGYMLDGNILFTKPYDMNELVIVVKMLVLDKNKVLLVDDDEDVLLVLKEGLEEEGYYVAAVNNGHGALALAKSEHPDIIILDLEMPDMYGGDIARILKKDPDTKDIPVVFLTGMFPKEGYEEGGRTMGSYLLLTKPYDIKELVAAIKKFMGKENERYVEKIGTLNMDKKTILIVDDEEDVLMVLEEGLSEEEYHIITADNGKDAVERAKSEHPDIIILDVLMPGMDGGEVARTLETNPETKDIPIMFLTGMFPKRENEDEGRIIADHLLFAKPYEVNKLVAGIEKLLQKKVNVA